MRNWVEHPLVNTARIMLRQAAVAELADNFLLREEISHLLADVLDLERLITKVGFGTANGRDLRAIYKTLKLYRNSAYCLKTANLTSFVRYMKSLMSLTMCAPSSAKT